jgi:hypothetical protein
VGRGGGWMGQGPKQNHGLWPHLRFEKRGRKGAEEREGEAGEQIKHKSNNDETHELTSCRCRFTALCALRA